MPTAQITERAFGEPLPAYREPFSLSNRYEKGMCEAITRGGGACPDPATQWDIENEAKACVTHANREWPHWQWKRLQNQENRRAKEDALNEAQRPRR